MSQRPTLYARIGPPPGARLRTAPRHARRGRGREAGTLAGLLMLGGTAVLGARPAAAASPGELAVQYASQEAGDRYEYGAEGPDTFDCSGLVQYVYARVGIALPRTSAQQDAALVPIPQDQVQLGDVISFFDANGHVFHNGIYAGNNMIWHAPETGAVVRLQQIWRPNWRAGRPAGVPALPRAAQPAGAPLKQGDRGPEVALVQAALRVPADGVFGPQTAAAVRAFQAGKGLVADGVVGPRTRAALLGGAPARPVPAAAAPVGAVVPGTPTLRQGASGPAVVALQRAIGVPSDGAFGPLTAAAVRAFQTAHGLTADAIVGAHTWAALGVRSA